MRTKNCFLNLLAVATTVIVFATPAQATLLDRDLNGDGVTDAYFDTDLGITWLRDANYAKTSGYSADGKMNWDTATKWASELVFGGYSDWRLPSTDGSTCDAINAGLAPYCSSSEMGHLWTEELGNSAGSVVSIGGLQNLKGFSYWSGSEHPDNPGFGLSYDLLFAGAFGYNKFFEMRAMAVRRGDVAASTVPEPDTGLLALVALGGLALIRRQRDRGTQAN